MLPCFSYLLRLRRRHLVFSCCQLVIWSLLILVAVKKTARCTSLVILDGRMWSYVKTDKYSIMIHTFFLWLLRLWSFLCWSCYCVCMCFFFSLLGLWTFYFNLNFYFYLSLNKYLFFFLKSSNLVFFSSFFIKGQNQYWLVSVTIFFVVYGVIALVIVLGLYLTFSNFFIWFAFCMYIC